MRKLIILLWAMLSILPLELQAKPKTQIKLMSYNIRHTGEKKDTGIRHWDQRKHASITMIRTEEPDIIGMQEVKKGQKDYLIENLPEYQAVDQDAGNSKFIMFRKDRFKQLEMGNFWLSETPEQLSKGWGSVSVRATLWVKLLDLKSGKELYFFDTHLDVKSSLARVNGSKMTAERMQKICGKRAIQFLVGDMNTIENMEDNATVFANFGSWLKNSRDTAPVTDSHMTYNGWGKTKAYNILDHIYYRNAKALEFKTLDSTTKYGIEFISDHFPVSATIIY